jgi:competence protein ComGC
MAKLSILKEMWEFIRHKKKYWLIPIIVTLFLLGLLLFLTEGSAIAPFIYTLF